ncbi:MAG: FAD-dependent oxidoreductase [Caldilineaceae bacterium]
MTTIHIPIHRPHVVVVGAGILGCSIAFHLLLRGAQVTLVEAGAPGAGATRVSFAWLNAYAKAPYAYHDLNRRSLEMWPRFVRRLGGDIDITWGGELRWAVTTAGAAALIKQAHQLQAWGYPTQLLTAAEVQRLEPQLPTPDLLVASHTAIEGHVNTGQVVNGCLRALTAAGVEICAGTPVTGLAMTQTSDGSFIQTVEVGGQAMPCDVVVLAGGAAMPELARMAGVALPLYDTFGATLLTKPLPPLFQNIALLHSPRDRRPHLNFRQFPDGTVMVQGNGNSNYDDGDRGHTDEEAAQILTEAAAIVPALQGAQLQEIRRGRRPIPQDGQTILGFAPQVPNLYLATTHSGVTLAPLIGEFAAIEIVDQVAIELLRPFRLERFSDDR